MKHEDAARDGEAMPIKQPDSRKLDELVRRIVDAVHPLRIILFGSAARGEMGPNSDLDVLVIMPDGTHRRNTIGFLYESLYGFDMAKDIIVATESDIREYAESPGLIYRTALREGKELYRVAPVSVRESASPDTRTISEVNAPPERPNSAPAGPATDFCRTPDDGR